MTSLSGIQAPALYTSRTTRFNLLLSLNVSILKMFQDLILYTIIAILFKILVGALCAHRRGGLLPDLGDSVLAALLALPNFTRLRPSEPTAFRIIPQRLLFYSTFWTFWAHTSTKMASTDHVVFIASSFYALLAFWKIIVPLIFMAFLMVEATVQSFCCSD